MNQATRRRLLHSFGLSSLLLFMLVVTLLSIWVGNQQAILTQIEAAGWQVSFDNDVWEEPSWWDLLFDPNLLDHVVGVRYVSNSEEIDAAPLVQLKNLRWLAVYGTGVSDLAPLAQLKNIEELDVSNTQVWDLSPLAQLKNLEELGVANTQVRDLSPLAQLKNLKWLVVSGTQVSDQQVQQLQAALPNCQIEY